MSQHYTTFCVDYIIMR